MLGVLCGLAAVAFSKALYWTEDQFEKLPIDEMWWPAIGALGLGVIGYFVPRVLGVGYDTIGDLLNARLALEVVSGCDGGKSSGAIDFARLGHVRWDCWPRCSCRAPRWAARLQSW